MKTAFYLMATFETSEIPLDRCCDLFGLKPEVARRKAGLQSLPVPVYKASESQKSPWLVSVDVLADYLDEQKKAHYKNFNAMQHLQAEDSCKFS